MAEVRWEDGVYLPGSDCETCGWTPEEVEVVAYDNDTFDVSVRVGCYGGESIDEASSEKAQELLTAYLFMSNGVQRLIERVKND